MTDNYRLTLEEIQAQMSERGKLEFDLAFQKALNNRLMARVSDLEGEKDELSASDEPESVP